MKAALVKKIIIRFLIAEVIFSLMALAVTPFLFGSIKPFKPRVKTNKAFTVASIDYEVAKAIKKAAPKKTAKKTSSKKSLRNSIDKSKSLKTAASAKSAVIANEEEIRYEIQPIGEIEIIE